MRAYITGATGFVGSNIAAEFAAVDGTEVHCPVRSSHPDPHLSVEQLDLCRGVSGPGALDQRDRLSDRSSTTRSQTLQQVLDRWSGSHVRMPRTCSAASTMFEPGPKMAATPASVKSS